MERSPADASLGRRLWRVYRRYVLLSGVLFVLGVVGGGLLADQLELARRVGGRRGLAGAFPEPSAGLLAVNNAVVVVLLVASALTLGVGTALIVGLNGFVVGYIGALAGPVSRPGAVLVGVLPHGVFEIPAFLLASAVAFRFSHCLVARMLGRRDRVVSRAELRDALLVVGVALALLPIAAVIEAEVTTRLLDWYLAP